MTALPSLRLLKTAQSPTILYFVTAIFWSTLSVTNGDCPVLPPAFQGCAKIEEKTNFRNFADEFHPSCVWATVIENEDQLICLMNACRMASGYGIRVMGNTHSWSPLTVTKDEEESCLKLILADLRPHFRDTTLIQPTNQIPLHQVEAGTGTILDDLINYLATHGFTINCIPSFNQLTLGGVLAVNGHGDGMPAKNEAQVAGRCYCSMSNLITELRAVIWNNTLDSYHIQRFLTSDPSISYLLVHLGRIVIISATLAVEPNFNLRCESRLDVLASKLFAHPTNHPDPLITLPTLKNFLDTTGRIKIECFPYTDFCWLRVWSIHPVKPSASCAVYKPYNYNFPPEPFTASAREAMITNPALTKAYTFASYLAIVYGHLRTNCSSDIWGKASDTLRILQVPPTATGTPLHSFVILTALSSVQAIMNEVYEKFNSLLLEFENLGLDPINGPLEVRVTLLDDTGLLFPGIHPPTLFCKPAPQSSQF